VSGYFFIILAIPAQALAFSGYRIQIFTSLLRPVSSIVEAYASAYWSATLQQGILRKLSRHFLRAGVARYCILAYTVGMTKNEIRKEHRALARAEKNVSRTSTTQTCPAPCKACGPVSCNSVCRKCAEARKA
jgi:hypothetical protein